LIWEPEPVVIAATLVVLYSWGEADKTMREIYDIVLKAQTAAIEGVKSGMNASQADKLARSVIEQAGYGENFGHGLGHGVGLAVHESPTLGPAAPDLLADGMVFTIEPGIYLPGHGGVRIEDMVVLENGKARVLTRLGKVRHSQPYDEHGGY
jgi:Xaa-Pro aminopeptidase